MSLDSLQKKVNTCRRMNMCQVGYVQSMSKLSPVAYKTVAVAGILVELVSTLESNSDCNG